MAHRLTACLAITAILVARLPAAATITDPPHTMDTVEDGPDREIARNHRFASP
jgi:hypothetical protein